MNHWPDLERCKALRERGFPQETEFYWTENTAWEEIPRESIHHKYNTANYHGILCAAPIVTELLEDIKGVLRGAGVWRERLHVVKMEDGNWYAEPHYKNVLVLADIPIADTLPNALADLWLWLREKGEKG